MKKYLGLILFIMFFGFQIVYGQKIETSVIVEQGSLFQNVRFSGVGATDYNSYTEDTYSAKLRATHVDEIEFAHTFAGQANTKITGISSFGVPTIKYTEKGSGTYVNIDGKKCCAVAAGSKFAVFGIQNYESNTSPGDSGMYCGMNYEAKAELGIGMIEFGYKEQKIGENITVIPAEEEGGVDTTTTEFGFSTVNAEIKAGGFFSDFYAKSIAEVSPPAGEFPDKPFHNFVLCADKPNGLIPWIITP